MSTVRTKALAVVTATALSVGLAAAGGTAAAAGRGAGTTSHSAAAQPGGTLRYYIRTPLEHTDPQRTYVGRDIANWTRTVYRHLVAFPISTDPYVANRPVPDLATTTGTSSHHAKIWRFTLKRGVRWQDGRRITCGDLKYGASRVFATGRIWGGPNYLLTYLDIPTDPATGLPTYRGPYTKRNNDIAAFNRAITCSGRTITYHFKKPWPDFPLAVAGLHMMDPYRRDKDRGGRSNYEIFSNGPYKLAGGPDNWRPQHGGTLVRNAAWDPGTDSRRIRKALPDRIVFNIGTSSEAIAKLLIADQGADKAAVTGQSIPLDLYDRITGSVARRAVTVKSPFVDYLAPNFKKLGNAHVRRALALATDTAGWIAAGGGQHAYSPATSIVNPAVIGYRPNPAFAGIPGSGDVAAAHRQLVAAGVHLPYPITFTYPSTPTFDEQAAALKATWDRAGFRTTLDPVVDQNEYYADIQNPRQKASVVWAGWGSDWPSAITVTAPLFDSRVNLTSYGNGLDYGRYRSAAFNRVVDQAAAASTIPGQTRALQNADAILGRDTGYIPLEITNFFMLRGSKVTGYRTTPASSMYPDLGSIGVAP